MNVTPLQTHVEEWHHCTRCVLSERRQNVVHLRGSVPCDLLFVGEAPGECITGDTLIETAFRDKRDWPNGIPVRLLEGDSGFKVYSFDTETSELRLGTVNRVWKTGYRKVYKVRYSWWGPNPGGKGGRHKYWGSIKVTDNHLFLMKNGGWSSIRLGLTSGTRLQPFYRFVSERRHRVGTHSSSMKKEAPLLLGFKLERSLEDGEQCHHKDRNPENDSWDNLELLTLGEHARLHGYEDNPMSDPKHRKTHAEAVNNSHYKEGQSTRQKKYLSDLNNYAKRCEQIRKQARQTSETIKHKFATDPVYYYNYLCGRKLRDGRRLTDEEIRASMSKRFPDEPYPPSDSNHTVTSVEDYGYEDVYDMEVEQYHNFAANGIFVHNSEDLLGKPFCGPAGKLLDEIIADGLGNNGHRYAITNLVGCIPRDEDGKKAGEPEDESIRACSDRLLQLVTLCQPQIVVCVGKLASDWIDTRYVKRRVPIDDSIPRVSIIHPAALLRMTDAVRSVNQRRAIITLQTLARQLTPF